MMKYADQMNLMPYNFHIMLDSTDTIGKYCRSTCKPNMNQTRDQPVLATQYSTRNDCHGLLASTDTLFLLRADCVRTLDVY